MASVTSCHPMRKAYCYNFYPSREEEEAAAANSAAATDSRYHRMLVEIREDQPQQAVDPYGRWQIVKTLNQFEIASGKIIVSFNDTFQYILRHWNFRIANHLAIFGHRITVVLWDFTNDQNPRVHKGDEVFFQMARNDGYILSCMEMMRDRNLKVDDKIGLYWDCKHSCFCFKVLY